MLALISSRHRNSLTCLNFQRTPFCFPSNYPRLAILALPLATSHVISIHPTSVMVVVGLPAGGAWCFFRT
jgi:hypothetical protein